MTDPDALGTLIRAARLDGGLSLGQLASAVGRSSSSVRRWERGETAPSADVVGDLANVLGIDEEELVGLVASAHGRETVSELSAESDGDDASEAISPPPSKEVVKTTIEDDDVVPEITPYFETPGPVQPPPSQPRRSRYGRVSSAVWGHRDSWIGWVRGFLTLLALFFLFMGFVWAVGELLAALGDVSGSFSTGG
jgi:transcriptional regulator with XRE-family HTH domain